MRWMKTLSVILFIATAVVGFAEVIGYFSEPISVISADLFGGIVLLVIATIFLRGLTYELEPFFYFGSAMLFILSILYGLVTVAHGLDALIVGEEFSFMEEFRVEVLLIPLAAPGAIILRIRKQELPP